MSTIRMLSSFARGERTYSASYSAMARSGARSSVKENTRNTELQEQIRGTKQAKTKKDSRYSATYEEQEEELKQAEGGEKGESARKKQVKTVYTGTIQAKQNGFLERTESKDKKKEEKRKNWRTSFVKEVRKMQRWLGKNRKAVGKFS